MTDWTPVIAIAEVAAAAGVIASLVYLAVEVRHNTRSVRASTYDAMVRTSGELLLPLIQDAKLARTFERVIANWGDPAIDEGDRAQAMYLLTQLVRSWENFYYQYRQGTLEDWLWNAHQYVIRSYFHKPGVQQWWQMRRAAYSQPFREFLESSTAPVDGIKTSVELTPARESLPDADEEAAV
jgi:hypothetical protein